MTNSYYCFALNVMCIYIWYISFYKQKIIEYCINLPFTISISFNNTDCIYYYEYNKQLLSLRIILIYVYRKIYTH